MFFIPLNGYSARYPESTSQLKNQILDELKGGRNAKKKSQFPDAQRNSFAIESERISANKELMKEEVE